MKSFVDQEIAGVRAPDSRAARAAEELARSVSSPMLFNHVMRAYYLGRLLAPGLGGAGVDGEVVFLSSVLHDLGLTDHARGKRRFEIEGADAARSFSLAQGMSDEKGWLIWDNIALHTLDLNFHKQPEARIVQAGILADVLGFGLETMEPGAVTEIVKVFPRLGFKKDFVALLLEESRAKPDMHVVHPVAMLAHHCDCSFHIPDARELIGAAPFAE